MSFLQKAKKDLEADSPFFRAEVLKTYTLQLVAARKLTAKDNLYDPLNAKWELTVIDTELGKEKTWTVGGSVLRLLVDQEIDEGDSFTVKKTGEVGRGKKYWDLNKVGGGRTKETIVPDEDEPPFDDELPLT